MNLTTTPTRLSPQRETGFSASPSSQLGWETLGWGRQESSTCRVGGARVALQRPLGSRSPHPGVVQGRCALAAPTGCLRTPVARSQLGTGHRPVDPGLRPEIQIHGRTSPRPARLRTWSTQCAVRTVAGSQDPVSTAAVLQNVLTKALFCNPRRPSTQPSAGYRCTGVVHSLGPLWVPKSLPS